MSIQKLRMFLLVSRRGLLPSSPPRVSTIFAYSSSSYCLSGQNEYLASETPNFHLFRRFQYSGKGFCSESGAKGAAVCWNCGYVAQNFAFLVCDSCRSVQPVDQSIDYFQIFRLEKDYDIENDIIEGRYKDWQKCLHPDLVHSKSERERNYAAEQSSLVNGAYRILANPVSRAVYILKTAGMDVDEDKTIYDPELLAEIMEIREAVEEALDPQSLIQIQTEVQEKLKIWTENFSKEFRKQNFEEAYTCLQRMIYYKRADEEILKKL
ncbi:iron-sulfur cluster co-chaperone protein HscB homolog [Impatiens glandulifera]|uniref:iron-sulfur cluster co-chaperone protein HscB homolog n=1 Tax=Impatiens glandulifera TaxID=253017 RepID=UPI001FB10C9C|nr:iron-sulfur cluster co-chaperone protein HscB homolog [Impatiens glandulifera]XP_047333477.1 iron-sulfur cluster co-chaperone protein HscB homolog [Impatiens glandulifera]XP_047333478.1 iron-sulfur cluster co-chaperone protein HscB homolog [Impatiens glandulifera]